MKLNFVELTQMMDLSVVRAQHSKEDVRQVVELAIRYRCKAVFTLPCQTPFLKQLVGDENVVIGGVVGFPSGGATMNTKIGEAKELIDLGCRELDMVINIGKLRSGCKQYVLEDIRSIVDVAAGVPVKVVLECHYLTNDEIRTGCELSLESGAAFVKTATGWAPTGATLENVSLIHSCIGDRIDIKAAGDVRRLKTVLEMYRRGARRFGVGFDSGKKIIEQASNYPGGIIEF
jgi:deoxyribose-phosphate aldolase